MKKIKVLGIVLLIVATITTFTLLHAKTIYIVGKGKPYVEVLPDGSLFWDCDSTAPNTCIIDIRLPVD